MIVSLSVAARAAEVDPLVISEILIQGNQTIAGSDIQSWMKVKPGDIYRDVRLLIDRDLKEIWRTGKFSHAEFQLQPLTGTQARLLLIVAEKPVLSALGVAGNKSLNEKELLEKSEIKAGDYYDTFTARQAAEKIQNYYKEKEFFQAEVTPRTEPQGQGVKLWFDVKEGLKIKVTKIQVSGNQAFSESKVKGFMETKEAGWFVGGIYKEETFKTDLKKILLGYAKEGYVKARLFGYGLEDLDLHFDEIRAQALMVDQTKNEMTLKLQVQEGIQYTLGTFEIKGNIIYSSEELLRRTQLQPKTVFDRIAFEMDLQQVRLAYSEKGYIYADVSPEYDYVDDLAQVNVVIYIRENTIARIEKIEIRGNTMTKDKVIRRELVVSSGQPFDTRQIQKSREKIMNLGFFQDVRINTEPGSTPGEQVLIFEVEERQAGTISLGAGYSSVDQLMGYLQLSHANLFGNGQSVSLQWEMGTFRQSYQMSFTEPWLFDAPVSFGVDVWNIYKRNGYNGQNYDLLSQGGDIRLGRRFTEVWSGYLTYKLESDEYSNLDASVEDSVTPGRSDTSSVIPALVFDSRDNVFDATTGMYHRLSMEVAGGPLGGDNNYFKYQLDTSYYYPLIWKFVLALHAELGYAYGYDFGVNGFTDIPSAKRFTAGGTDTVRGYGEGSFGPASGGRTLLVTNAEIHFPIIGPLKGVTFFDAGNVWSDFADFRSYPSMNKGVGFGVRLTIPGTVILIRFDFGYPLDPDPSGTSQGLKYHFNIGNIF